MAVNYKIECDRLKREARVKNLVIVMFGVIAVILALSVSGMVLSFVRDKTLDAVEHQLDEYSRYYIEVK